MFLLGVRGQWKDKKEEEDEHAVVSHTLLPKTTADYSSKY